MKKAKRSYVLRARAERQADTRARIVEAIMNLHAEVGPRHTTVSAIAKPVLLFSPSRSYDESAIAATPSTMPTHVTVEGFVPDTAMSHAIGTPDITTAAAGAADRKEPRE